MMITHSFTKKIQDADKILLCIGEEWRSDSVAKVVGEEGEILLDCAYACLANMLEGKDYFAITMNPDERLTKAGFDEHRMVSPCGNHRYLQCDDGCMEALYELMAADEQEVVYVTEEGIIHADCWPCCKQCGKELVYNTRDAANYLEEGYQRDWIAYCDWLGSVRNKALCVLELGVSLQLPMVIRWPVEKMIHYQKKAFLYRVHQNWSQIPVEISAQAIGIAEYSPQWIIENLCDGR